jgi:hypothetical protein
LLALALRSFILHPFSHLAVSLVRQETGFPGLRFSPKTQKDAGPKQPIFDPAPNAEGTSMKTFCGLSGSNQGRQAKKAPGIRPPTPADNIVPMAHAS